MRCLLCAAIFWLAAIQAAKAQQIVLPLSSQQQQDNIAVLVDSLQLSRRQADGSLCLSMRLCLVGASLQKGQRVVVQPRLCCGTHTVAFTAVEAYSSWAYYHAARSGQVADYYEQPASLQLREGELRSYAPYLQSVAWQPWMEQASLQVAVLLTDGCGQVLASDARTRVIYNKVERHDDAEGLAVTLTQDDTRTQPIAHRFNSYKPLLALKTNVLFDLALAPNLEIEVPFGNEKQWSLMVEDWLPWFRTGHNPAGERSPYYRSDQRPTKHAYQIWTLGAELRYWISPRCMGSRPALSGFFAGIYGAGGKYDVEWNSEGDQGEFVSFGLSAGYSWPIARHWNIELSGSVGYVGGPQRHYKGEFDDARLIYRHDDHLRYVGPTKLKLSVAWLLPAPKKKGGAR